MNLKLLIAYDGSRYDGWQRQSKNENTIQGKIESVIERYAGSFIPIQGAGRTDAGVHAAAQVANVHIEDDVIHEIFRRRTLHAARELYADLRAYLNEYLPEDIEITHVEKAGESFHARLSAQYKVYRYRIGQGGGKHVFDRRFCHNVSETLNIDRMREAAALLSGSHDFFAFCANRKLKKSAVRTIYAIEFDLDEEENLLSLTFIGNGFLQHMIRILVGTLIEVGSGRRAAVDIERILQSRQRKEAGPAAPAKGLCLMEVGYRPYVAGESGAGL